DTPSSRDSVDRYLDDLDTTSRITPEDEIVYANRIGGAERAVCRLLSSDALGRGPGEEASREQVQAYVARALRRLDRGADDADRADLDAVRARVLPARIELEKA